MRVAYFRLMEELLYMFRPPKSVTIPRCPESLYASHRAKDQQRLNSCNSGRVNDQRRTYANGEPKNINKGEHFIAPELSECNNEKVLEH